MVVVGWVLWLMANADGVLNLPIKIRAGDVQGDEQRGQRVENEIGGLNHGLQYN
jgi:hypothetical protein